jgi:hypothetical protein
MALVESNLKNNELEEDKKNLKGQVKAKSIQLQKSHNELKQLKKTDENNSKVFGELSSKMKGMEQELSNAANTNVDLEKKLKEISQALTVSECENEKLKYEKNELQVEDDRNKSKIVEMKASNAEALVEVYSIMKEIEIERNDLSKKVLNAAITQETLKKNLKVCYEDEIKKLKKEQKSELQLETEGNKNKIVEMKESNAKALAEVNSKMKNLEVLMNSDDNKLKTLKDLLAAKVLLFDRNNQNYDSLRNLEVAELFSKYENTFKVNDSFKEKYEEIKEKLRSQTEKNEQCVEANEELIKVRTKLNVQMKRNELLDNKLIEIMDTLSIPGKNRSFAYILPAIENLKEFSKSQEQEETEHYTNTQALVNSIGNSNDN